MPSKLQCPSCGASLLWKGVAPVVECRYCGTNVVTGTGEQTDQPADARSQPSSGGGGSGACAITVTVSAVITVGAIFAFVSSRSGPGGGGNTSLETITQLTLDSTIGEVVEATGARASSDENVCIWYRDGGFEYVCLHWDDRHPDHVKSFAFHHSEEDPDRGEATIAGIEAFLGRRLVTRDDGDRQYTWARAWVNAYADGTMVTGQVDVDDDPDWRPRLQHLWMACLAATQGEDANLDLETRQRWLGGEYPLRTVERIDLSWDVDEAQTEVRQAIPGASDSSWSGLVYAVAVDHPWFGEVRFRWPNEAGGKLEMISFIPPPGRDVFPDVQEVRRCVSEVLGEGDAEEVDHLAGKVRYGWHPDGFSGVTLYPENLGVSPFDWHGNPPSTDLWTRLLAQLEDCSH